jgi:integrase-like protein
VIHHSDQGSQYTSIEFGHRCREAGVRPSMGSVGDAYDNAMCESFFATLECELLERCRFKTQTEARSAVFAFIEGFYNPRRRHSSIGYLSPIDYEHRHHAATVDRDAHQPAAVLAAVKDKPFGRPPKAAKNKSTRREPSAPSLGARVLALATGKTRQELYAACPSDRPNHVGMVVQRHIRAGRIQERDGKLYATSPATEQAPATA